MKEPDYEKSALQYALAKQLPTAHTIASNYGDIELDEELRAAVEAAVRPILERRLAGKPAEPSSGLGTIEFSTHAPETFRALSALALTPEEVEAWVEEHQVRDWPWQGPYVIKTDDVRALLRQMPALGANKSGPLPISVLRICEHCNKEFKPLLTQAGNASWDMISNFPDCTHCGKRNDLWILIKDERPTSPAPVPGEGVPDDARLAFAVWARGRGYDLRDNKDGYVNSYTRDAWDAYQAALSTSPASLPDGRGKPSWNDAPEWARWLAQDANGCWSWYEAKPYAEAALGWWGGVGRAQPSSRRGAFPPGGKWWTTLEERPS